MTTAAELTVEIRGRDVNVESLLKKLDKALQEASQRADRAGAMFAGPLAQGQQRAAQSALALAAADARLLRDQGQLAAAADRLRQALAGVDQTTVQSINARQQLLAVENPTC